MNIILGEKKTIIQEMRSKDSTIIGNRILGTEKTINKLKKTGILCTDKSVYMPLSFIKLPYKIQEEEDRINPSISTSLALGKTKNQAILTGIYEVIEREAFAISWLLKLPPNKELKLTEYLKCEELILSKNYKCRAFDISL